MQELYMVKIEKPYMFIICTFHFLVVKMYPWDSATDVTSYITQFVAFEIWHMWWLFYYSIVPTT